MLMTDFRLASSVLIRINWTGDWSVLKCDWLYGYDANS